MTGPFLLLVPIIGSNTLSCKRRFQKSVLEPFLEPFLLEPFLVADFLVKLIREFY